MLGTYKNESGITLIVFKRVILDNIEHYQCYLKGAKYPELIRADELIKILANYPIRAR